MAPLPRGYRLGNRYRIEEPLAHGGMGAVYRATDQETQREVAVKVMHAELSKDPIVLARFEREARAVTSLHHPGIVQLLDIGTHTDGSSFLVMELIRGETLAAVLQREGKLAPERAADLVEQALFALSVAHGAGVIHRDLKPANLMIVQGAGREEVKVLDFGVAQLKAGPDYQRLTGAGVLVGTPAFMAPEQARGESSDARTDVYALGVLLWSLCTGRPPFPSPDVADVLVRLQNEVPPRADVIEPAVGASLGSVIAMAMQKRPEDRFASASAFASALVDLRTRNTRMSLPGGAGPNVPSASRAPRAAPRSPGAPRSPAAPAATGPDPRHRRIALVVLGFTAVALLGLIVLAVGVGIFAASRAYQGERADRAGWTVQTDRASARNVRRAARVPVT